MQRFIVLLIFELEGTFVLSIHGSFCLIETFESEMSHIILILVCTSLHSIYYTYCASLISKVHYLR